MTPKQPSTTAARIAVLAIFFVNGGLFINWAARIPAFKGKFHLTDGELGLILLAISAGVITALAFASTLVARFGSKTVTVVSVILCGFSLALLPLMPTPVTLWLMLFFWGGMLAMADMAMNTQAAEVERRRGKPTMSSFHAAFSAGGIGGSLVGFTMAAQKVPTLIHFGVMAVVFGLVALAAMPFLLHVEGEQRRDEPPFSIPPRAVWALGLIAMFSALAEGAVADWSAVYLSDIVGAPNHIATLGLTAFNLTMTIGRISGDWLAHRFPPTLIARIGGLLGGLGLMLAVLFPQTYITLIGFATMGIGLSNIVPLAFSAAGNVPGVSPSKGITGVATIAYAAFLAGPPLIGHGAQLSSLQVSLGVVAALALMIAVIADAFKVSAQPAAETV